MESPNNVESSPLPARHVRSIWNILSRARYISLCEKEVIFVLCKYVRDPVVVRPDFNR